MKKSNILQFGLLAIGSSCLFISCQKTQIAETKQPNILFFLIDDQRNETLGCYGHPILKTPNIDRLAENGTRFSNAFVTTSICMASRATIFSGLVTRSSGVSSYWETPMDTDMTVDVYPRVLKRNGYRTGFIGKFGFTLEDKKTPDSWFDYYKPMDRNPYFKTMPDGTLRHETDIDGDYAIEFLRSQDKNQPFCLSVSFNSAHAEDGDLRPGIGHYPWPPSTDGMYEDIVIPDPRLSDSTIFNAMPPFLKESLNRVRYFWRWDTPEKYQVNMKAYFRMISGIDNVIGRVLAELEKQGLAENTIVVYLADNGYYMGDRGFAGKWSHYEQSLRVPMIIYDPRLPKEKRGLVNDEMVLNLDMAPTFIDLAGLDQPKQYQGKSLMPLVRDENPENWRTSFYCEHLNLHPKIPKWEGIRSSRYVYARYFEQGPPPYEFLHDLSTDPDQLVNLVDDENCKDILDELRQQCDETVENYESVRKEYE